MTSQTTESIPTDETKPGQTSARESVSETLAGYVRRRAAALQRAYRADDPGAVAALARLRRAVPSDRQLPPEAWDIFEGMPGTLLGHTDEPSAAEYAAAASLALFAVHQQSRRDADMYVAGREHSLGRAVGQLARKTGAPGVERRFRALTRAADVTAALQHLRGLITQLRGERIPLDYGSLAVDLYRYQRPASIHGVRMRWTRDFHRPGRDTESTPATPTGDDA